MMLPRTVKRAAILEFLKSVGVDVEATPVLTIDITGDDMTLEIRVHDKEGRVVVFGDDVVHALVTIPID